MCNFVSTIAALALFVVVVGAQSRRECVVIYDVQAKTTWRSDAAGCATRLSPASTFKIPHALVALELGAVMPTSVEQWDGRRYADQPLWNRDHTVLSAMKPSVLWFFQRIAPRVGAERMQPWLQKLHYGNADVSGDITRYWVNGTLRVSPDEQVDFLRRFYARELPVRPEFMQLIEESLAQAPGTVENARGVHKLTAQWPAGVALNSKTGATTLASGESVSWLVGALSAGGRRHVFASVVWRDRGGAPRLRSGQVDQLDAARLAITTLNERAVCQCPLR
jgi:beta-lactamase class D